MVWTGNNGESLRYPPRPCAGGRNCSEDDMGKNNLDGSRPRANLEIAMGILG